MNIKYRIIFLLLCAFAPTLVRAQTQDTVIKGATIEITQSYRPEVNQAPKPTITPNLPPVETEKPTFQYNVPQQTLNYTYSSLPLRPLALDKRKEELPFQNYIKAGGGNRSTIYLDAGISSFSGKDYETAFHLHHLSQSGVIKDQKSSLSGLEADGTLHKKNHAWHGGLDIKRNQFHNYGYNHDLYNYSLQQVRQTYTGVDIAIDVKNEIELIDKLNYNPSIKFSTYNRNGANSTTTETREDIDIPVSYRIDSSFTIKLAAYASLVQLKDPLKSLSNNILQLKPELVFKTKAIKGNVGLYPTVGKNGTYFLPNINVSFNIPESQFTFSAGWQNTLRQNTYEELTTINPYMTGVYNAQQTLVNEVYGAIKSNIGDNITFGGKVSWWQYEGMPLFVNDTATDLKQFVIISDPKVNAISIDASVRYQIAEIFAIGLRGRWNNFINKTGAQVWHVPGVSVTADLLFKPTPKFTVTGYATFLDEIYALDKNNRVLKLNALLDLGAGAEYEIIDRLSAFINVNNILNNKYQRWYGYQVYGINVFGGVRIKF